MIFRIEFTIPGFMTETHRVNVAGAAEAKRDAENLLSKMPSGPCFPRKSEITFKLFLEKA